jgi:hypothetical protein
MLFPSQDKSNSIDHKELATLFFDCGMNGADFGIGDDHDLDASVDALFDRYGYDHGKQLSYAEFVPLFKVRYMTTET